MEFTDKNFEKEVLESEIPVFVDFWASWCPPCKMVESIIDELEKEYVGKVKVGQLNVDRNPIMSAKYGVRGVPTFVTFKEGKIIHKEVAAKSKEELKKIIEALL